MAIVAPVAPSAVTPLPTPPSTSDPVNFDTRADAFLGGLPTNQTQMNALGTNVYDNAVKTFDSATISKASADAAVPAATTATNAANDATSAYTNMQKLYLGAKATAPTVDNQGNPLVVGAWYTNTTDNFWYWWTGSLWKLGVGDLDTVDFETQVTNKGRVVLTDTTQNITGHKRLSGNVVVGSTTSNSASTGGTTQPTIQLGEHTFLQQLASILHISSSCVNDLSNNWIVTKANVPGTIVVFTTSSLDFYRVNQQTTAGAVSSPVKIGSIALATGNFTVTGNITAFGAP